MVQILAVYLPRISRGVRLLSRLDGKTLSNEQLGAQQ
jgi:hypothetical protein